MQKKNILIIINPASGKDEPVLNILNDVLHKTDINWDVRVTKEFGDAEAFTLEGLKQNYDMIVGYGGDGTQHELANVLVGKEIVMGILPGGTGNGFAAGLGIPRDLRKATEILVSSQNVRGVDVGLINEEKYFLSRLYTGIEEDAQTSREQKDKYGLFAYAVSGVKQAKSMKPVKYKIYVDDKLIEETAIKCYIANSGSTGAKISIGDFKIDDGLFDVFAIGNMDSLTASIDRSLKVFPEYAQSHYWQGKVIKLEAEESQPVWVDGEFYGRTPITVRNIPKALKILCP